jgi:hypothetical protein
MKARKAGLICSGALLLAGCAHNGDGNAARQDTLNDRSDRMDLKSIPTVVQHDPALNEPTETRADKGLTPNPGADQLIKAQDPKLTVPAAVGGPAQGQTETVTLADSDLAARVKEAVSDLNNRDTSADPALTSPETQGETKTLQNLEVSAKSGVVMLSGSVSSDDERTAIEQAASRVKGVTSVSNYLTVAKPEVK